MSQFCRVFIAVVVTALAALTACDSSPTSPTTGQASSNRILGSFVSETSAASRQTARANTSYDGINVSVRQDARITVAVSSNGTFTLEDVPLGRVTIIFTRDGAKIGEVDIRGVASTEEIRVTLELTANDTVVLVDMQRTMEDDSSDDGSSDDNSEDAGLDMELDPDNWCPEWAAGGNSDDDPVFATLKGDSIGDVDLESISLVGPSGVEVTPASVVLNGDRIEVVFDNPAVIGIVADVSEGERVDVRLTGTFDNGAGDWELTESIRIKCDDDDSSDDNSSDDSSSS